jgi:hypothetical protein
MAPDFAMMFRFKSLHVGPSWFYTSQDRCKTWQGPFKFDVEGVDGISTRTSSSMVTACSSRSLEANKVSRCSR